MWRRIHMLSRRLNFIPWDVMSLATLRKKRIDKIFRLFHFTRDLKSPATSLYAITKRLQDKCGSGLDEKGRAYCDQILKTSEHIRAWYTDWNSPKLVRPPSGLSGTMEDGPREMPSAGSLCIFKNQNNNAFCEICFFVHTPFLFPPYTPSFYTL